ncbi:helix-turn-helix transcriptional regulator [Actinomadura fulvescens]|uniref:Helix-turn-helix transcriptional regulator n=1 Tax=Actinomadura fulvescens TaxID=46160 RepID=A0ABP6C3J1_9ACTN
MATPKRPASTSPGLKAFGRQLKRCRDEAGLTQEVIANRWDVTTSFVSQVERGKKRPKRSHVETADRLLKAGGVLLSLYDDLASDQALAFPDWSDWAPVEAEAVMLISWQPMVVHGLLQTEAYAGAILRGNTADVEARMQRQTILTRDEPPPPRFTLLLEEGVLHRRVGSPGIMRDQLLHLVSRVSDQLSIQVVPARGEHDGNAGSVTLARLDNLAEVAYVETIGRGFTLAESAELGRIHKALEEIRSLAYNVDESVEIINKVVERKWT